MRRLVIVAAFAVLATAARGGTVHDLGGVDSQTRTQEGRFFTQLYSGKPQPDRLGLALPAPLPASVITRFLAPPGTTPTLVGAKPWPGVADRYVAIVCTGGEPDFLEEKLCATSYRDNHVRYPSVYLGVIVAVPGSEPKLVAKGGPVDTRIDWSHSLLPEKPQLVDDAKGAALPMQQFGAFDLAHYEIAPGEVAFGLRGAWENDPPGGGNYETGLVLFVNDGDRLRRVLGVPMSAYYDSAGEMRDDGTRSHAIDDNDNVIVVESTMTAGHFDLVLKSTTGKRRRFRWSEALRAYGPA